MPPRKVKSGALFKKSKNQVSLTSLLNNFLDPNLSQAEITQNAFTIQLQLAKCLSSRQVQKSRNLLTKATNMNLNDNANTDQKEDGTDSDSEEFQDEPRTKKRKTKEQFDQKAQDKFAEKAISIIAHFLTPSNQFNENEEIAQNILTIMNFIPSLLQKVDSSDQAYIQNLLQQIDPNVPALFELQIPLLHSISEILHGPQLSASFQGKMKSFIKPNSTISSSLLNICIFNFEFQKNYQYQWAEIIRMVFLSSNRQELLNSSLLLKSKRTCSNELCIMLCRVLQQQKQDQRENLDKLDFFLILIISSINSIATNKLLKFLANNNRLNELTIKNCPLQIVPVNNIIDAIYSISSSKFLNATNDQMKELSRIISEIFICSENSEILTFALFNEDENKILLESTINAISISSKEAPQLFISNFDSVGVLYTVSKQIAGRLIKPILKLATIFTQLFDSIVIYLKKLTIQPSGTFIAIDSLCSLLKDLAEQQQVQQQQQNQENKRNKRYQKKQTNKNLLVEENQSNSIEMQLQVVKILGDLCSSSQYMRHIIFQRLSNIVSYLSEKVRVKVKKIANKYKELSLNPDLFLDLVSDKLVDESNQIDDDVFTNSTNFVFAKEYPASELQLLISLGEPPSDFFYFVDFQDSNFRIDFHFALQLALRADVYAVLSPFNNDAFIIFSEYLKAIDYIASEEERKIISEWCSLRLDDAFVRNVIIEERYDDPLLLYTILRQINTSSTFSIKNDNEIIMSCRKLFIKTAECDCGVPKLNLVKHHRKCKFLPKEAFNDVYDQFKEELTFHIGQFCEYQNPNEFFDFGFFVDEMKKVIMGNAITGRHCQSYLDIFEKSLPVSSESAMKMFDLLATLKFADFKLFSTILELTFSKSPKNDAFVTANLLLSCVKGENQTVLVRKETLKNAVLIQLSKFISSVATDDDNDDESYDQMMSLLCDLMNFNQLNQAVCFSIFKSINIIIKLFNDNLNKSRKSDKNFGTSNFFNFDKFIKFKNICENWFSINKPKIGVKRIATCSAYLQMAENVFNKQNNDDEDDDDDLNNNHNNNEIRDFGPEFDVLFEKLQNDEIDKDGDDEINIEELLSMNDNNDNLKKKKKKKDKKLPHFVPRKWRSKSRWIDEGLKEVTDSDDNFADLEDFVVENSPPQSDRNDDDDIDADDDS